MKLSGRVVMDDLNKDTDALMFAKALHGWVGAHTVDYAEQRAADFDAAGDLGTSEV
jgi:hypothetical protein